MTLLRLLIVSLYFVFLVSCRSDQRRTWSMYKADEASSSYSPIEQVNTENVRQLKVAWTFYPNDALPGSRLNGSQCNPIVIDDVMYVASSQRTIFALDASTGKKIWSFDPYNGGKGGGSFRGVTYWEEGNDKRILFTAADHLYALDATNGKLITSFGSAGRVSMNTGIRDDSSRISIKPTSPGIIFKNLIIIGNEVSELYGAQPGYIRAYNVKTGKLEWTFHTVPLPGEFGYDTWPADAWKYAGGANSWAGMSIDEERGLVFASTGSPSYDFYGADRKGMNLFGNCILALDAATGKRKWHFQTVHHDLWDYDLPAPRNLVTIERNGKKIDAVAQVSKVGFIYVLDRDTGKPIFPIEEKRVPASDVPGEEAWPTQPFPAKPAPFSRQFITINDLSTFSGTSDSLKDLFNSWRYDGLFTPPSTKGSLNMPGTIGGAEWGGAAYDPTTSVLFVKSNEAPEIDKLVKIEHSANALRASGREIYDTYCATCHKADRTGEEPLYPSLTGLKNRMTETQALEKIKRGGGKMPPFAGIISGNEKALINFLFDRRTPQEADLAEIASNRLAKTDHNSSHDSTLLYLNTEAYALLKDPSGKPFIRAPWATLNAINLNTGEYVWKVPAGNMDEWQEKGAPRTGATGLTGPTITKGGLLFLGGSRNRKFEAYDVRTGSLLWEITLPGMASSNASSYLSRGKQYIAVSTAGTKEHPAGSVVAFALGD